MLSKIPHTNEIRQIQHEGPLPYVQHQQILLIFLLDKNKGLASAPGRSTNVMQV